MIKEEVIILRYDEKTFFVHISFLWKGFIDPKNIIITGSNWQIYMVSMGIEQLGVVARFLSSKLI